jgi:NDP-sugar pyrophosphorylase family protein
MPITVTDIAERASQSQVAHLCPLPPWAWIAHAERHIRDLLAALPAPDDYSIDGDIAVHRTSRVEAGAVLKGPLVIGPRCFIAAGAYLRGGNWIEGDCVIGPGVELKSSFVFAGTHIAHFNFVGDSIVGSDVNLEAGSIVCNHRNERQDKRIRLRIGPSVIDTGVTKLGALIGDHARIGANAVLSPGTVLPRHAIVARASLVEQDPEG